MAPCYFYLLNCNFASDCLGISLEVVRVAGEQMVSHYSIFSSAKQ